MIINYLKVAWRNLIKFKLFSLINVIGLSLSMSVCLVLINLIYSHFQYDTFHPERDRLYRINSYQQGQQNMFLGGFASSSVLLGEHLKNSQAGVEKYTILTKQLNGELRTKDNILEVEGLFADEHFFQVFGFTLLKGNPEVALSEPNSIVLDEIYAQKLFPNEDPMDQMVEFDDKGTFRVTGISKTPPTKSHITFDALASIASIPALVQNTGFNDPFEWQNIWNGYNYLLLKDNSYKRQVTAAINEKMAEEINKKDSDYPPYRFELQSMSDIVPGPIMNNSISFSLPWFILVFFGLLGVIVVITASINYANLSIAKSLSRTKEIAIRKANGARRFQIVAQFLLESVILALISLGGAILFYKVLLVKFNEIWIFNEVGISLVDDPNTYIFFIVFSIVLGLATGLAPATFLSKLGIVSSLKGMPVRKSIRSGIWRYVSGKKALVGFQYGFAVLILVSLFLIKSQAEFFIEAQYGFSDDEVFFVELQNNDPDLVATELSKLPVVQGISFASHHPATGHSYAGGAKKSKEDESITLHHFGVDENYIDVMDLELVAGTDFPAGKAGRNEKFILINETAVKRIGFESNPAAVGQTILFEDSIQLTISGVLKDYHWESIMQAIRPVALRLQPERFQYAYFKVDPAVNNNIHADFEAAWSAVDEGRPFSGGFLNEELDLFYQFFYDISGILMVIGVLALSITSLGFLGMIGYELKSRVKEVGIRKVLGASFTGILLSITRGFIITLFISLLIAVPAAILVNNVWIDLMAKKAPFSLASIAIPVSIVVLLSAITIFVQMVKTMKNNPIEALRSE